jgi:predicted component of type VI protein secretion system
MPHKLRQLVIGDTLPTEPTEHWDNFAWLNPATREIYVYVNGQWVVSTTLADTFSTEGYTGEIKGNDGVMVFENGILVKYG